MLLLNVRKPSAFVRLLSSARNKQPVSTVIKTTPKVMPNAA